MRAFASQAHCPNKQYHLHSLYHACSRYYIKLIRPYMWTGIKAKIEMKLTQGLEFSDAGDVRTAHESDFAVSH